MKNRIVFFLIGAGLLGVTWLVGKSDFSSRNWKPVDGQVVFSKSTFVSAGNWEPVVRYRYTVDGKSYESGNHTATGGWGTMEGSASTLVLMDYPKGGKVKVYYNPANPAEAALQVGLGAKHFVFAFLGLGFMALAIFLKGSGSKATSQSANAAASNS